jgi:hypothetical protein
MVVGLAIRLAPPRLDRRPAADVGWLDGFLRRLGDISARSSSYTWQVSPWLARFIP